jgi:polyamine oxidase
MSKKIIIIGAGIAGLAACKRLIELGFDAKILEARDRCGGRIWIDKKTLGRPIGLGAQWIHGDEINPIAELAKKTHAASSSCNFDNSHIYDRHGQIIPREEVQTANQKLEAIIEKAQEHALGLEHDVSLATAMSGFFAAENLLPVEQDILKRRLAYFQGYMGADAELLSARHWDQEEILPGGNSFLTSTYLPILEYLEKSCPIQLNTIVKEIITRANSSEVVTENETFSADAVLLTVSLGVLKNNDIRFDPPLPENKLKAIQTLGMGLLNITALKFPHIFWDKNVTSTALTFVDNSSVSMFFHLNTLIHEPILIGYSGGNRARELEKLSDATLIANIMQNFKKVFGANIPEPDSYLNTRWSQDPFSHGSYSYIAVGATAEDYVSLSEAVSNRLFFAGEATSQKYSATTHGAYLSGIREAEKIKQTFG